MAEFDTRPDTDPHTNGTILAAALWELRNCLLQAVPTDRLLADRLLLKAQILIGGLRDHVYRPTVGGTRKLRSGFDVVAGALLRAEEQLCGSRYAHLITTVFLRRGIEHTPCDRLGRGAAHSAHTEASAKRGSMENEATIRKAVAAIRSLDPEAIIPTDADLLGPEELEVLLDRESCSPFSLIAVGDVMLGARARRPIRKFGPDYPFAGVEPLFGRSSIVLANLEGPIAKIAAKQGRNFNYRVNPKNTRILRRAGINVVTLANNHLLDCGRDGVLETLQALELQGILHVGAGTDSTSAHCPAISPAGPYKIGVLGYYWNRRTAARRSLPGSAMDLPDRVASDLARLRTLVDRIVVTVHWGVPYEREPTQANRAKARFFIDCGADAVIGHHPHVIQPFELYRGCPIFYSIGNFAFGSGNSRSESLLLALRFEEEHTDVHVFPVYVRNRDPRIDYQPKVMSGLAAQQTLSRLADLSKEHGAALSPFAARGLIRVPRRRPADL